MANSRTGSEDNYILNSTGTSHIYIVGFDSHNNTIDNNELDGDIYIGSGDNNNVTTMEFEYLYINSGEDNIVYDCEISRSVGVLVTLFEAHGTCFYKVDLDGINDNYNGIEIEDSMDVVITGYDTSGNSIIDNCDVVLYVKSDDISSTVDFKYYTITEGNGANADVDLHGTASYSTTVKHYNSIICYTTLDVTVDGYSTWTA